MGVAVFVQSLTSPPPTFTGSALVKSVAYLNNPTQPLACVINQQKPSAGKISSYVGFDPASATAKIALPIIVSKNSNCWSGYQYSAFSIASVDGLSHTSVPLPAFRRRLQLLCSRQYNMRSCSILYNPGCPKLIRHVQYRPILPCKTSSVSYLGV
jgi:hypothetical protein